MDNTPTFNSSKFRFEIVAYKFKKNRTEIRRIMAEGYESGWEWDLTKQ